MWLEITYSILLKSNNWFCCWYSKSENSSPNKYITKPVTLENASTVTSDIRISAYIHSTADKTEMYFRLSDATDARKMQEIV